MGDRVSRTYRSGVAVEPRSAAYRTGALLSGLFLPFVYGVVFGGLGLRALPWGNRAAFAVLALQATFTLLKTIHDREAPFLFIGMAVVGSWYALSDWPRNAWTTGMFVTTILWGLTGTRAKWARPAAALPAALLVAGLFGVGDTTLLTGRTPSVGHEIDEIIRLLLFLSVVTVGPMMRKEIEQVRKEKDEAVEEAAGAERARISRELHDVVSHHVTVMVLQAEGAKATSTDPKVSSALGQVVASGRTALNELRRLLGVLREPAAEAELEPQPDLSRLPTLVDEMKGAGLNVELVVDGEVESVAPGVGLSGYRIVQEALTNSLRHSGSDRACVAVSYTPDSVAIEVSDSGGKTKRRLRSGTGSGLVGMQEWAAAVGGSVDAGPRPSGGYAVQAKLPRK